MSSIEKSLIIDNILTTDPVVVQIAEVIGSEFEIVRVPYKREKNAETLNCYYNVQHKINREGGSIQYGWALLKNELLCEAEHHAVWESPKGELFDITPRRVYFSSILFIPDDRYIFTETPIDNVRLNATANKVVDDFIIIAGMMERIIANGIRTSDRKKTLHGNYAHFYDKYQTIGAGLVEFITRGNNSESTCYCRSGNTYSECHGKKIKQMICEDVLDIPNKIITIQDLL